MTQNLTGILVRPLLTERGAQAQEQNNTYTFEAALGATKTDIKAAVQTLFEVEKVRTMIVAGKFRRMGRGGGLRPDWKKAIVTVKKGQKIDFAPQSGS
jgi:large subunit ribosomal protein L23